MKAHDPDLTRGERLHIAALAIVATWGLAIAALVDNL